MVLVLIMLAVIWASGKAFGFPTRLRLGLVAILYLAILAAHLVLPDGNALRVAVGGTAAGWAIFGGMVALVFGYRWVLDWVRSKVPAEVATPPQVGTFSDKELSRYARHIVIHEIGVAGQKKLKNARVLVIGAGGLGSPVLLYLSAAGVGTIGVIDDDVVDNSNLQRQVIHNDAGIGMAKVASAKAAMEAQNPAVIVRTYQRRLDEEIAADLIADYDIVMDGTDNFATRYLANTTCVAQGKPLISGALAQWEGQVNVFDPARGAPCYQCVFPQAPAAGLAPSCAEAGVVGPLPGVIGAMMAIEAIKIITGAGVPLRGEMLIFDALYGESRKIAIKPRADCPICGDKQ